MAVKKKHGLGKGLNALIKSNDTEIVSALEQASSSGVKEIDISLIDVNPLQPRKVFNKDEIEGLAETILEHGLINPITLREKNGRYQIISGERRFRALKHLDRNKAPSLVLENVPDSKMLELTLIENIQREDLNPIEIAESYKNLIEFLNIKQDDLAKRVGKNRSTVANAMRILDLSDDIKNLILEEKISEGHARALLSIKDEKERNSIALSIIENSYTVRDVENISKDIKASKEVTSGKSNAKETLKKKIDPNIKKIESYLEKIFATKVSVDDKNGNEGRIIIEYYSTDDFERIIDILDSFKEEDKVKRNILRQPKINY